MHGRRALRGSSLVSSEAGALGAPWSTFAALGLGLGSLTSFLALLASFFWVFLRAAWCALPCTCSASVTAELHGASQSSHLKTSSLDGETGATFGPLSVLRGKGSSRWVYYDCQLTTRRETSP